MKCIVPTCTYPGETSNPDGICGYCRIKDVLADYINTQKAKEFVRNMGQGALEESKQQFFDGFGNGQAR